MAENLYTHQDENVRRTWLLMTGIFVLLIGLGWLFSRAYGNPAILYIVAVFGVIGNIVSYWYSDKIALASSGAVAVTREQNVRLYRIVENLCITAGLPLPRLFVLPGAQINAFATGRDAAHAAVAVTQGALERLNDNELAGVLAHELSHVKHRDILISSIAATVAGAITYLAHMAQWAAMFGGGRDREEEGGGLLGMLVMAIVAPLAALLIQMAISRSREYDADKGGAEVSGNPLYLAGALRKLEMANRQIPMESATPATAHMFIVNPLTGGGLMSLFSTHPPVEERIKRLESMVYGFRG